MSEQFITFMEAAEPWLYRGVVAVLIAAAACFGFEHFGFASAPTLGGARVVVFDVVKLANAQRRVASAFLGKDPGAGGEQAALLLDVQARTQSVIRDVAGPGTIVMVKQAIIHTELEDITDEVLKRLRLPTTVPTQDPSGAGIDYTPTILGMTPPPRSLAERRVAENPLAGNNKVLP